MRIVKSRIAAVAAVVAVACAVAAWGAFASRAAGPAGPSGTLVWAKSFDIKSIDPSRQHEVTGGIVDSLLYDTLMTFAGSTNGQPRPLIATAVTGSKDQKTFTFKLRRDVKFSDGTPLTSKDVVFSFNRLKYVKGTPSYEMNGLTVSAKDPYTVVVQTEVPNPGLPAQMASSYFSITNSAVVKANGGTDADDANTTDKAQSYLDTHSAGSGPYTLVQYTPQATVILKANPTFWGKKPAFAQIVLKNVPAATQALEVQKGTANLAVDLAPDQVTNLPGNVKVLRHPSATFFFLESNMDTGVSVVAGNKTFQQAIRYAIDYKNIVQLVGQGAGQIPGFIPSVIAGTLPTKWQNHRDLAKAKALIKQSGVTDPTLTLEYPNDFTLNGLSFGTIAQRIQSQLAEAGIKVELTPGPLATTLANWRAGKEQLGLWTTTPDYPAPYTYLDFCPGGNHAIRTKWMAGADKALEKLCAQASATSMTDKDFGRIFTLVQRKLLSEGPYYPLFQPAQVILYSSNVTNVTYSPTTFVDIRSIGHK